MSGIAWFLSIGAIIIVGGALASYKTREAMKEFWASRSGKNVPGGIYMVYGVMVIFALTVLFFSNRSDAGEAYLDMYVGLESTFEKSLFCKPDQFNDRLTSNVGFKAGYAGIDLSPYAKYQHHSCGYNQDEPTYDAVGGGLEWSLYRADRAWFSGASLFAGIDYSDDNVICSAGDSYSTNAGGALNVFRSGDGMFFANAKAQYHNCLRGPGVKYFGGGIELVLRVGG